MPTTLPTPEPGDAATPSPGSGPAADESCSAGTEAWWTELPQPCPGRVGLTGAAAELLLQLVRRHGPVMFHQSGGCCDGSAPMCYPDGDFLTGDADVLLGHLVVPGLAELGQDRVPVWISRAQYPAWRHTHLCIDAVPGRGAGFSLEGPEGLRFLTRSRLLTEQEAAQPLPGPDDASA